MKLQFYFPLFLLIIVCITSCSNSEKTNEGSTPDSEVIEQKDLQVFKFSKDQLPILKNQLFQFLRNQIVDIDENSFVKYEELNLSGDKFNYSAVVIEKELLSQWGYHQKTKSSIFTFASYTSDNLNFDLGDSINIIGSYKIDQTSVEKPLSKINITIETQIHSSTLSASPYAYSGYERVMNVSDFNQNLLIDLNPKTISNKELYLKARILELTKEDLIGLSSNELGYLRNEIFARHGHAFKTDKMKSYFNKKSWYHAYYEDATPYLNEIEKKNANFIKSLED